MDYASRHILSLHATVASCKKSEKLDPLIFPKTCKTILWAHFWSLLAQKP